MDVEIKRIVTPMHARCRFMKACEDALLEPPQDSGRGTCRQELRGEHLRPDLPLLQRQESAPEADGQLSTNSGRTAQRRA